ncbi:MAG: alanine racemase [Myxococcota bacterium]
MKALIDLNALGRNLARIRELSGGASLVAMVKANAYGHGLVPVTRFLESKGVSIFGVARLEEGEVLRQAGISSQILLMAGAGAFLNAKRLLNANVTPVVSSFEELEALEGLGLVWPVHIDIDTGMSRAGFSMAEIPALIQWFKLKRFAQIDGLITHFANAESAQCEFTAKQLAEFEHAVKQFESAGLKAKVLHVAKSTAIVNSVTPSLTGYECWVRPGIALYGGCEGFEPVMSWQAPVTLVKNLEPGMTVGYNQTWKAQRETKVALLRAGYGDGYPRSLSSQGSVLIGGKRAPVIGRVSMDVITVDVTDVDCQVGDRAVLLGQDGLGKITAQELAETCGTISYEIFTRLAERVEREYVGTSS